MQTVVIVMSVVEETPINALSVSWFLYVIRTVDNFFYAGITTDVERRFNEHTAGGRKAAKYLLAHKPSALVFFQAVGGRSLALKVEYRFKRLTKRDKETIVACQSLIFDPDTGRIDV
jgi:putative endonuclease